MKKLILSLGIVFGLFLIVGSVSASTADVLQPASTITYNEELVVNATGRFDSVYIGKQGVGGVTFFNGTIINATTTDDGSGNPVAFGDDVRIDGTLFRTEVGGDNPLKLADTIRPETTNMYDLGTEANVFRSVRATNLYGGAATITSTLAVGSAVTIGDELNVDDYIAVGGGGGEGVDGVTIGTDGDIIADGTVTAGGISTSGDIEQDLTANGAVKAMVEINGDAADCLEKSWTANDTDVTCERNGAGDYTVTFDDTFDVDTRYYTAVATDDIRIVQPLAADNVVAIGSYDDTGVAANANIMFIVY